MFTKQFIQVSTVIALMAISITGFAQTKVVVIPLFGDDIPAPVPEPKIVFVSAEQPNFNFAGVTGADLICEREAEASDAHSSLAGKEFKAWLYGPDTDTFPGDAPNPGRRSFNIPEGDLLSPTGQSFDAASAHFLTIGNDTPVIGCDSSGSFSDCVAEHERIWPLELLDGTPALAGSSNNVSVNLVVPSRAPEFSPAFACDVYTSEDFFLSSPYLRVLVERVFLSGGFSVIRSAGVYADGICGFTAVSVFCVEQ